ERLLGEPYFALVQEFVDAVQDAYPQALIQFEDFATPNAYELLNRHRDKVLCFNDDIQGTAAVALAGIYASTRISGIKFEDLKVIFLGAGSAATGIGDLIVEALEATGLSNQAARERLWFVNSKGLLVKGRAEELPPHTLPYAHNHEPMDFVGAITSIKPHVLIGATGSPGTFTEEAIRTMAEINTRPTIFALSNPTSQAECTAEQAYEWSDGRVIFASGSPFSPVEVNGKLMRPGQGNNAYIFPGIGLGAIASGASIITDDMFLIAAKTLAATVREEDLEYGTLYPPLSQIRDVSLSIATAVAEKAYDEGIARTERPTDIKAMIQQRMYQPYY
ncbi:MAG: oxaloacetate-decarboxylating malate dehydrogenase, partial [Gammaproteobacteria bacterium]